MSQNAMMSDASRTSSLDHSPDVTPPTTGLCLPRQPSPLLRGAAAIALVALVVLLAAQFTAHLGSIIPYLALYPAVMVVALLMGPGPAVASAIVGTLVAEWSIAPGEPLLDHSHSPGRAAAALVGAAVLVWVGHRVREARGLAASKAQIDLVQQRELFDRLIANAPAMIFIYYRDQHRFRPNPALQRVVGRSGAELATDLPGRCFARGRRAAADALIQEPASGWHDLQLVTRTGAVVESTWASYWLDDQTIVAVGTEIGRWKAQEEVLRSSRDRLALALDAAEAGMSQTTYATGELMWNARQFQILGYVPHSFSPDPGHWRDRVHPEDLSRVLTATGECSRQGMDFVGEYRVLLPGGEVRWVQSFRRYQHDEAGRPLSSIGVMFDITQRKVVQEQIARAKAVAEAASAAKDHFLAMLSHELRTPLTPALALAQLLESDPEAGEHTRELAGVIRRNVQLEARLIDDLLDLTRVSRGKLTLKIGTVDLHACVRQVAEMCAGEIRAKRLRLDLQLDAGAFHVRGDPARLHQVLWNLLRNAVKFTPAGGSITLRTRDAEQGRLALECVDTGIGIPCDRLPHLFTPFEQGGDAVTRTFGGLGLGLSLSKAIVDAHGGTLSAFSAGEGQGACLRVELQTCAPGSPEERTAAPAADATSDTAPCRILLVEDHRDTAAVMQRLLERWGHSVSHASNLAEALEAAGAESFDVVISDLGLPDGSGLELMPRLAPGTSGIALSGFGQEEDVRNSHAAGYREHLVKPVNVQQLQATLARVLADRDHAGSSNAGVAK